MRTVSGLFFVALILLSSTARATLPLPQENKMPANTRWKFGNPQDPQWCAFRDEKLKAIDSWWEAFESKKSDIDAMFNRGKKWDLAEWMIVHLQAIDPRLMWEFGPGLNGGHRLVITPESDRELRPLVETILSRAPKIHGFEFYTHRLPETAEQAEQILTARGLRSLKGAVVQVSPGEHNTVDLTFYSPEFMNNDDDPADLSAAFICTESILGEQVLDTWVGVIETTNEKGKNSVPLSELQDRVSITIQATQAKLPEKTLAAIPDGILKGTLWKLKPKDRDDYPRQLDLIVGRSILPGMWSAAHSDTTFFSERFSRHNERFCYVKLDGTQGLAEEGFADKAEIEDALDAALRKGGLGAVVGGGTGKRYSYVDLALVDLDKGISLVRNILSTGKVPKRSWVLFFDAVYANEWVGIYDDTPPPPR